MPEIIVKLGDSIVQKNIFVKETIRIGRVPDNEIVVENLAVSRYHAVIEYEDGRYLLTDLDSSNGTFVNGVRVKKTELQDRDVVTIGKHKLYFYDHRSMAEPRPRPASGDIERTMLIDAGPAAPPQAELEVVKGRQEGTRFVLGGAQTSIGKGAFNDIQLTDWFVSKMHAVIERRGNQFVIRDMGSWRHTFVNGVMTHEIPLSDGDTIQLGPSVQLAFRLVRPEANPSAAARIPVELDPAAPPQPVRAPEPVAQNGEETSKVWRPRYVEWRDPDPQPAAPQEPPSPRQPEAEAQEPASEPDRSSAAGCSGASPWAGSATSSPGAQNGVSHEASPFAEHTLDELDEVEAPAPEIEAPVMSAMHLAAGAPDGLNDLDDLDGPAEPAFGEPEPEPESEPEPPQAAPPEPPRPVIDRRRSALEELAAALGLDEEQDEPAPASPAAEVMTPEPPPTESRWFQDPLRLEVEITPSPVPEAAESEPIKLWTAPPETAQNEPDLAPEEVPWETPEEVPAPAPQEDPLAPQPQDAQSETSGDSEAAAAPAESDAPAESEAPVESEASAESVNAAEPAAGAADPEILREILMWERALQNKNPIIRKQAARQLQKLTGKEYDHS